MADSPNTPRDVFDRAWDRLASHGRCDARGSMEYVRVRGQWDRLYGVMVAVDFIVSSANQVPPSDVASLCEQVNLLPEVDLASIPPLPMPEPPSAEPPTS